MIAKQECSCGARMKVEGRALEVGLRWREFLDAHKECGDNQRKGQQFDDVYRNYVVYDCENRYYLSDIAGAAGVAVRKMAARFTKAEAMAIVSKKPEGRYFVEDSVWS